MSYQDLGEVLKKFNHITDKNLLSGFEYYEDAAVYRISEDNAVIFTVDFITPIVNNPYTFGKIAAANALSDVFAMGGKPLLALNIVCFPADRLCDLDEVIKGGLEKVQEAGAFLVGGHSIKDNEPKYGLAVLGLVHPEKVIKNHTPQEGDYLILTKPLGTGIISTALKAELLNEEEAQDAIRWMSSLNDISDCFSRLSIHSMTDITGFGFLGHLSEMMSNSDLVAEIRVKEVPVLEKASFFAEQDIIPGGSISNKNIFSCGVEKNNTVDPIKEIIMYDAQTSGGLLIALAEEEAKKALDMLHKQGFATSKIIGRIRRRNSDENKKIHLF